MTKEEKAILLLEVYNQEKQRLTDDVKSKKAKIVTAEIDKEISSADADRQIHEVNDYLELESSRIERRFLRAICALQGD